MTSGGGAPYRRDTSSAISEIVTVLCEGAGLAQGTIDEVQGDEKVIEVYLGR